MDSQSARLWMAMGIGPLWIGRDDEDPLSPAAIMREESRSEVQTIPTRSTEKPSTQSNEDTQAVFVKQEAGEVTKVMVTPAFGVKKVLPQSTLGAQQPPEPQHLQSPGSAKPNLASLSPIPLPLDSPGMVTQKPCSDEVIAKASWDELRQYVSHCQACQSMCTTRLSTVFGVMEPTAKMVIVGEAPGRDEDIQGKPFVGKSGELLENILGALGLVRGKDVAIVNVLKCRPPKNRDPHPQEVEMCRPYLQRQLSLLAPKVIVLSGRIAAHALLATDLSMKQLRQSEHSLEINDQPVPVIVTYHPSYLLRSPTDKLLAWRDFVRAKHLLLNL